MDAKTTLAEEFSDSKWVVPAKVTSADYHWSDEGEPWTIYNLRVQTAYKGALPSHFKLFTYRDSGGFYLDKGANADLGGEYLLFLDPEDKGLDVPAAARRATEVNYSCGQSRAWDFVGQDAQQQLNKLMAVRQPKAN